MNHHRKRWYEWTLRSYAL